MESSILNKIYKAGIFVIMFFALNFAVCYHVASQDMPETPQQEVQTNYSEEELQQFVSINKKIVELQQESQEKMAKIVEEENLDLERFNQLAEATQNNKMEEATPTEEEMVAFNNAAQKIINEQQVLNTSIIQILDEEGVGVEKFEEMITAYQQDPKMQEDVNNLLEQN